VSAQKAKNLRQSINQLFSYIMSVTTTDGCMSLASEGVPDFGPNVFIFDPSMSSNQIQSQVDNVFQTQQSNQFGDERYALLFKPGSYDVSVQVGFYTTVHGLGTTPDAVTITGGVNVNAAWFNGDATQNFWRGVENLAIVASMFNAMWATAQGTWLRRLHILGILELFDFATKGPENFSSGGFIADSVIDVKVISGSQQQYITRNTDLSNWEGQVWNMVFVGDYNTPNGTWPTDKFTVVSNTPIIREKPYIIFDEAENYSVIVPGLKYNSEGPSWTNGKDAQSTSLPISQFYIAKPSEDNATTLNLALQRNLHLLLTPGIYELSDPIEIINPNTVVLGLGVATLRPTQGTPAMKVADVDGVTIAGLLFDAGNVHSEVLIQIGDDNVSTVDHSANPTAVFDVSCRVGGAVQGAMASGCMILNSRHVILDNIWLWRADHGITPVGWDINPAYYGLIVNGDDVTAYGLFVEHFKGFQTLWNGNGGSVYFYQSEIPYDVPTQDIWNQNGEKGYPSYKVSDNVTTHMGLGIGVYCNFYNPVQLDNAIETPQNTAGVSMDHLIIVWLNGASGSAINHLINGIGDSVWNHEPNMTTVSPDGFRCC
jgi:hypothetical protein